MITGRDFLVLFLYILSECFILLPAIQWKDLLERSEQNRRLLTVLLVAAPFWFGRQVSQTSNRDWFEVVLCLGLNLPERCDRLTMRLSRFHLYNQRSGGQGRKRM